MAKSLKKAIDKPVEEAPIYENIDKIFIEDTIEVKQPKNYSAIVNCDFLNVRELPSMNSQILQVIRKEQSIVISDEENGFGKLADMPGWVKLDFIRR